MSEILLRDPVNRHHRLNYGRVAWWLTLPGLEGGKTFYDIMGMSHGALTGMTSTVGWRGTSRPGGFGHVLFNAGVAGTVNATTPNALNVGTTGDITIAAWANGVSGSSARANICHNAFTSGIELVWNVGAVLGTCGVVINNADTASFAGGYGANAWRRYLGVRRNGTLYFYVNGVQVASVASTGNASSSTTLGIGGKAAGTNMFTGPMDDVTAWSRGLSDSEILAECELSKRGYPDVINRVYPSTYFLNVGVSTQTISPTGIGSGNLIGTAQLNLSISPTGIGSGNLIGTAQLNLSISPTGIGSGNLIGTAQLNLSISPSGIDSGNLIGTAVVSVAGSISPTGIGSTNNLGTAQVNLSISPTGIGSTNNLGTAQVNLSISPTGIGSTNNLGTAQVNLSISPTGIGSTNNLGNAQLNLSISPTGIGSTSAIGVAKINLSINATGIASTNFIGVAVVAAGGVVYRVLTLTGTYIPTRTLSGTYIPTRTLIGD